EHDQREVQCGRPARKGERVLDAGLRGQLLLERVHVRPERCDPVRFERVPQIVELTAGLVRRGEVEAGHRAARPSGLHNHPGAEGATKMIFLGFGKYARADKIYALEPIESTERGKGRRTRVWVE